VPANANSPAAQTDGPPRARTARQGGRRASERLAQPIIPRPRLLRELAESLRRRLTVVVADAGYGKSVLLRGWAATVPCVWYSVAPDDASLAAFVFGIAAAFQGRLPSLSRALRLVVQTSLGPEGDESDRAAPVATLLCETLEQQLGEELVIVFDDVHELGQGQPSVRLIEELCRQAPVRLHVVLASRLEPPFPIQRLRGQGEVLDVDAAMLAFTEDEVRQLLAAALDADAAALAPALQAVTAGWPAAVRLAVEALRPTPIGRRADALDALHRPGGRLFDYMAEEVFGRAAPGVRQLLRRLAPFDRFNADLCKAIGVRAPADSLAALRRAGLFLETRGGEGEWFGLHTLVREFAQERWPLNPRERREVHRRAAAWFQANGCFEEALDSLAAIADTARIAEILEGQGAALLAAGKVQTTIRIARTLPPKLRSATVNQLLGEAHEIRGEWDEALEYFKCAAGDRLELEAGLAWRLGLIHHLRGRLDEALAVYERGQLEGSDPRDAVLLLAWKASACWLRGDADGCRRSAEQAFARASAAEDARALAAAHTVLAMHAALTGDRLANDAHYLRALEYAERAGDVLQAVRVRTNRGSQHVEEGEYEQALAELEIATRLGDLTGFIFFRALALTNRGEARFRLGRLEEAISDLEASKALYQRAGSRMVCYPLAILGDVYRERGDAALAQALYEEALARADEAGDMQGLVPALAGLAQILAFDDPARARMLADRAVSCGEGMAQVAARLASGWVALAAAQRQRAAASADEAAAAARLRRDRAGLAQALELAALASPDRDRQAVLLEEAASLWRGIANPIGEARAELILGLTRGAAGTAQAEQADRRLRALGARGHRPFIAAVLPAARPEPHAALSISTLGRFGVTRDGWPVAREEWQSKKARDLLKILVARRGRATPRDLLMEALWPEQDPSAVANRLSVALSTLRGVLDPESRYPTNHFLAASGDALMLQLPNVNLDIETFLEHAEQGLSLWRSGRPDEAQPQLELAEAAYVGDFLEEDRYEDWAAPLREEARTVYLTIAAALADITDASGDPDGAIRYRLRILERDPFDERAHLGVVTALLNAGRHGEARRTYRDYESRMQLIGVEAAPFPRRPRTAKGSGRESNVALP
jgi:ATP/maltotriose-dependent transcriptional regulator MalT/DNA-binding SARP family transcriptional activator